MSGGRLIASRSRRPTNPPPSRTRRASSLTTPPLARSCSHAPRPPTLRALRCVTRSKRCAQIVSFCLLSESGHVLSMPQTSPRLTVGITTRNRPVSLQRCVESLRHIDHLAPEVLIFDDASEVPAADSLTASLRLRVIRDDRGPGCIAGRNI